MLDGEVPAIEIPEVVDERFIGELVEAPIEERRSGQSSVLVTGVSFARRQVVGRPALLRMKSPGRASPQLLSYPKQVEESGFHGRKSDLSSGLVGCRTVTGDVVGTCPWGFREMT